MQLGIFVGASVLGGMLGALMQYALGQRSERRRSIQMRRTEAYVDLIKAASALATLGDERGPLVQQMRALYGEARARIAIYGGAGVSTQVVEFLRSTGEPERQRAARLAMVVGAMRAEGLGSKSELPAGFIEDLLFSPAPPLTASPVA